jgi:hypothetical protein
MSKKFDLDKYNRYLQKIQSVADGLITDNDDIRDLTKSLTREEMLDYMENGLPEYLYLKLSDSAYDWAERTASIANRLYPHQVGYEMPTWALRAIVFANKRPKKK